MTERLCRHCEHASFSDPGSPGVCSRFPPTAIVIYNDDNGFDLRYAFPPVLEVTQACGEFKQLSSELTNNGVRNG